jgi:dipeptidyl aminopeptidase/acylaminoacyl peptidase
MVMSRQTIFGILCITALVIVARWVADHPVIQPAPHSTSNSAGSSAIPSVAVMRLDWSIDGRSLLYHSRGVVEGESSLRVQALVPGGPHMPQFVAGRAIVRAALAPDGRHLLLATHDELAWMDTDSFAAEPLLHLRPEMEITDLAVFDSNRAAAATRRGTIYVADPGRQTVCELVIGDGISAYNLRFSHDGKRLVSGSADGSLAVWDLDSRTRMKTLEGHGRSPAQGAFLPGGERLISAGFDDTIRIWEIAGGHEEWRKECGVSGVRALDLSPDGRFAAWAGFDRKVAVWDLEHRRERYEFTTLAPFLTSVRFSPDGMTLAVAGGEDRIRIYDLRTGGERTLPVGDTVGRAGR